MKPTIGRIVLFYPKVECVQGGSSKRECYASMVTAVNDDGSLELVTFGPNSVYFQHSVPMLGAQSAFGWAWPPREEEV